MLESTVALSRPNRTVDVWLRIAISNRRLRFAALLSRLTGLPLERAWGAFRPLPNPVSVEESAAPMGPSPMNWD
jgi:hypothetical protein